MLPYVTFFCLTVYVTYRDADRASTRDGWGRALYYDAERRKTIDHPLSAEARKDKVYKEAPKTKPHEAEEESINDV